MSTNYGKNYGVYKSANSYSINKSNSDHIYFNIEISNPLLKGNTTENNYIPASFYENLTQPLLSNPSEYYISIVRFRVPGTSIPIFIADIINNQPNINLTAYVVCLSYQGNDFPQNIIYQPDNISQLPKPPIPFQDLDTTYYYVYSYQHMIDMINIAFESSFAALKAAFPAAPPTQPPFLYYDATTQLISIVFQTEYAKPNSITSYVNNILGDNFLNGFPFYLNTISPDLVNGKDLQFKIGQINYPSGPYIAGKNYNNAYTAPLTVSNFYTTDVVAFPFPPPPYITLTQEYVSLQQWNSFKNIVFLSGTLPVQAELIPSRRTVFNEGGGQIAYSPILTDYEPLLADAGDARSILQYYPTGPYRLLDLISTVPITKFDVSIYWQDYNDFLHPIYISTTDSASIKFLFIKK